MNVLRITVTALLAAASLAVTAPRSQAEEFQASVGSTSRWMRSSSVDSLTEDDQQPLFDANLGISIMRLQSLSLDLGFDLGLQRGTVYGNSFQRVASETSLVQVTAGLRVTHALNGHWSGFARTSIGMAHAELSLSDTFSTADSMSASAYAPAMELGGGFEYMPLRLDVHEPRRPLRLGLRAEWGYSHTGAMPLEASPTGREQMDGTITIPDRSTNLGELDVSGWHLGLSMVGKF